MPKKSNSARAAFHAWEIAHDFKAGRIIEARIRLDSVKRNLLPIVILNLTGEGIKLNDLMDWLIMRSEG